MTVIEKLYEVSKQLPDQMQTELLDFAVFLKQKISKEKEKSNNFGLRIHARFKEICLEELVIPKRKPFRNPPELSL